MVTTMDTLQQVLRGRTHTFNSKTHITHLSISFLDHPQRFATYSPPRNSLLQITTSFTFYEFMMRHDNDALLKRCTTKLAYGRRYYSSRSYCSTRTLVRVQIVHIILLYERIASSLQYGSTCTKCYRNAVHVLLREYSEYSRICIILVHITYHTLYTV